MRIMRSMPVSTRRQDKRGMRANANPSSDHHLRVSVNSQQGHRDHMEDTFCVAYQPTSDATSDERRLAYSYFGIFDGHGGADAAIYVSSHLLTHIISQEDFWKDEDELVLGAIKKGFLSVHQAMLNDRENWPRSHHGMGWPSTAGTTASIVFIRGNKLYIGHVGDSGIVLGFQDDPQSSQWKARTLTKEHKADDPEELAGIQERGGTVATRSSTARVVWKRERIFHEGRITRSTQFEEVPFLAMARALGDFWSYNPKKDTFVVSPEPDTSVIEIDKESFRCLILASDGLWNVLSPEYAVNVVRFTDISNNATPIPTPSTSRGVNQVGTAGTNSSVATVLVQEALNNCRGRADNTTAVTIIFDSDGLPELRGLSLPAASEMVSVVPTSSSGAVRVQSQLLTQKKIKKKKKKSKAIKKRSKTGKRRSTPFPKIGIKRCETLLRNLKITDNGEAPSIVESCGSTAINQSQVAFSAPPNSGDNPSVQINDISSSVTDTTKSNNVSRKTPIALRRISKVSKKDRMLSTPISIADAASLVLRIPVERESVQKMRDRGSSGIQDVPRPAKEKSITNGNSKCVTRAKKLSTTKEYLQLASRRASKPKRKSTVK